MRRIGVAVMSLSATCSLAACQYLDRTAVRMNADGTFDVASCETLDGLDSADIDYYVRGTAGTTTTVVAPSLPDVLTEGDVIHFGTAPASGWDRVSFSLVGADRWEISGVFDQRDMVAGEWLWAQSGMFVFSVDVEHCAINE